MNMIQIKEKAKMLNIKPGRMKKTELIRTIQTTEGHTPCYKTNNNLCEQLECCWRKDCLGR